MKTTTQETVEQRAKKLDIVNERIAREAQKNRSRTRRVNAWRKKMTGKVVL